jgi:4-amino-4-deoxy-L-arabinose transferase-like glycosyltransferase
MKNRVIFYAVIFCGLLVVSLSGGTSKGDAGFYFGAAENLYKGLPPGNGYHPLLVPYLMAGIFWLTGGVNEALSRFPFPCFYLAALALTVENLVGYIGERKAELAGILFVTMILPFMHAKHAYTDLPLAVMALIATIYGVRYWRDADLRALAIAFAALLAGCFIKISGLPILVIFSAVVLVREIWKRYKRY